MSTGASGTRAMHRASNRGATRCQARPASRREVLQGTALATVLGAVNLQLPATAAADTGNLVPLTVDQTAALQKAMSSRVTKVKAPVLLRQVFHDSGTYSIKDGSGGPNASLQYELDRPENQGLKRGWSAVKEVRKSIKGTPADSMSDSDLIAALGARSVAICVGPSIPLYSGRTDAIEADPTGRLPDENAPASELKANFARQGFSVREFVCLCGAHTLGNKGFGDPATFDNAYFVALLRKPWLDRLDPMADMIGLNSDHVLPEDEECLEYIKLYAKDQAQFHADFVAAYSKITTLGYA